MAAVRAAGLEAECCGMLPTPALALHAITQRIPAVMVTGSHIPFDRNGLKFYRPDGEIDKLDEQAILAAGQPMPAIEPTALPPAVPDAIEAYVRRNLRSEEHTSELPSLMRLPDSVSFLTTKTSVSTSNHHKN